MKYASTFRMSHTYVSLALCLSYRKKPMNAILTGYSIATLGLYGGDFHYYCGTTT